jgi:hypothetical protein
MDRDEESIKSSIAMGDYKCRWRIVDGVDGAGPSISLSTDTDNVGIADHILSSIYRHWIHKLVSGHEPYHNRIYR